MTPFRNTHSIYKTYKESLAIFPDTSTNSPPLSKSDLKSIHNDIKAMTYMTDKHHSDIKTLNEHISVMIKNVPI